MLKVSIAFVFGKGVEVVRKSVFDQLVLASLMNPNTDGVELSVISNRIAKSLGCDPYPESQILAAIRRLETKGFVRTEQTRFHLTDQATSTVESATIEANALTNSLISDIVEEVSNI